MNSTQTSDAIDSTHEFVGYDGVKVLTLWANTKTEATKKSEAFRSQGADLSRIFSEKGCLGKFRIVGHFYPKEK